MHKLPTSQLNDNLLLLLMSRHLPFLKLTIPISNSLLVSNTTLFQNSRLEFIAIAADPLHSSLRLHCCSVLSLSACHKLIINLVKQSAVFLLLLGHLVLALRQFQSALGSFSVIQLAFQGYKGIKSHVNPKCVT
jgi:hypothetical protein